MKLILYKDARKRYVVVYGKRVYSFSEIEDCLDHAMSIGEYLTDVDDFFIDYIKKNNHRIQYKGGWSEFIVH